MLFIIALNNIFFNFYQFQNLTLILNFEIGLIVLVNKMTICVDLFVDDKRNIRLYNNWDRSYKF
jgi:hypothetical protein